MVLFAQLFNEYDLFYSMPKD
uniref:Uncharacterized protein n=1 Tax=Rhizophora mucronata TaxID=61149 RepID=A0A2P2PZ90_RHIMU